jgi:hypothetical protein
MPAEEIDGATDARDRIKLFFKVKEDTWAALCRHSENSGLPQ